MKIDYNADETVSECVSRQVDASSHRREMGRDDNGSIELGSFRVVRPEKNGLMAEQVVIQVRDMIRHGSLNPGDRYAESLLQQIREHPNRETGKK